MARSSQRDGERSTDSACSDHSDIEPGRMLLTRMLIRPARSAQSMIGSHPGSCLMLGEWTLVIIGS